MSWLPYRWRTQRNAIRHANCNTSESSKLWTQLALPSGSMSVGVSILPHHKSLVGLCRRSHSLPIIRRRICIRDATPVVALFLLPDSWSAWAVWRGDTTWISIIICVRVCLSLLRGEYGVLPSVWTSNQSRIPAEFKHITRRRKRN